MIIYFCFQRDNSERKISVFQINPCEVLYIVTIFKVSASAVYGAKRAYEISVVDPGAVPGASTITSYFLW